MIKIIIIKKIYDNLMSYNELREVNNNNIKNIK